MSILSVKSESSTFRPIIGLIFGHLKFLFKDGKPFGWYTVHYEYLPLTKLWRRPAFVSVWIHSDVKTYEEFKRGLKTKVGVHNTWVACFNRAKLCEFNIPIDQAVDIVRNLRIPELSARDIRNELGLSMSNDLHGQTYDGLYWVIEFSRRDTGKCRSVL